MGLPTPAAALLLVSYVIFSYYLWDGLEYGQYLVSMVILVAALMVSQIEYDAMPDNFNSKRNRLKLMALVVAAIGCLIKPRLLMFPIFAVYVIIGLVREMYRFYYLGVGLVKKHQSRNGRKTENVDEQ